LRCYSVYFFCPQPKMDRQIFVNQHNGLRGRFSVLLGPLNESDVYNNIFRSSGNNRFSNKPPVIWFSEVYEFNFDVPFSEKHTYDDHLKMLAKYIVNDSEMYIEKFDSSLLDGGVLCQLSKMDQENNWNLPP
jgi:hypothetical protein